MSGRGSTPAKGGDGLPDRSRGNRQKQIHKPSTFPQQDTQVRKLENETEAACKKITGNPSAPADRGKANDRLPLRPGYGTQGQPILLMANYFKLVTAPELVLYQHSIDVIADAGGQTPTGRHLKRIIELLLQEHVSPTRRDIATDFKSFLLSRSDSIMENKEYTVRFRDEGEDQPSAGAKSYRVRVLFTRTLQLSELIDYLTSSNARRLFQSKEDMIQALNVIVGHYPKAASTIVSVGANKHFDGTDMQSLGGGLTAVRGLFVSVRAATSRLLVNVQVKHGAFYDAVPLGALMSSYGIGNPGRLGIFLRRVRVRVSHVKKKNMNGQDIPKFKTITSLAMPQDGHGSKHPPRVAELGAGAKDVEFYLDSQTTTINTQDPAKPTDKGGKTTGGGPAAAKGEYVSVYDFFRRNYNITIRDPNLPIVNVGSRDLPVYLPADVCTVVRGQPFGARLSEIQTANMVRFAVRGPALNARSIITSGTRLLGLGSPPNPALNAFGVQVNPELIAVPGRVMTSPAVRYRNNAVARPSENGSWNMAKYQVASGALLPVMSYLYLSTDRGAKPVEIAQQIDSYMNSFRAKLIEVGINVQANMPGIVQFVNLQVPTLDAQIDQTVKRFVSGTRPPPNMLVVILPKNDKLMYNAIKRACDVIYGLRHVCVIGSKWAKNDNHQYFANVALKINLKLGGRNQYLEPRKLGIIAEGKTMLVGIDVTHPSPGSASGTPSVAGVVASVDKWLGQWPAALEVQTARKEMVEGLDSMFKSRLTLWARSNAGTYPQNILVYRDGVSEGQYKLVIEQELPLLRKACKETYPADATKQGLPRISIIIVGKRHNTRFYPTKEADADNSSNPRHGTIVDRGVTEACLWDFFLQAHTALQGTARPAHYYVIVDEIFRYLQPDPTFKNAADVLQDLTHNLCYLFGRATKPVSICPPAYYADLVCERARRYMSQLFDASPEGSVAGSVADGGNPGGPNSGAVRLHERIKDTMFYI